MSKPNLYLDIDGVIIDTIKCIVGLYNDDFYYYKDYKRIYPEDINTYDFSECMCANKDFINTYFNTKRFFDNVEFMENAQETIYMLNNFYNITLVSHGFSPNLRAKVDWINYNLPFVKFIGINLKESNDKSSVDMSNGIFVDDKVSNLISSNAKEKIIFGKKYPWNIEDNGYKRFETWIKLYTYLRNKITGGLQLG